MYAGSWTSDRYISSSSEVRSAGRDKQMLCDVIILACLQTLRCRRCMLYSRRDALSCCEYVWVCQSVGLLGMRLIGEESLMLCCKIWRSDLEHDRDDIMWGCIRRFGIYNIMFPLESTMFHLFSYSQPVLSKQIDSFPLE